MQRSIASQWNTLSVSVVSTVFGGFSSLHTFWQVSLSLRDLCAGRNNVCVCVCVRARAGRQKKGRDDMEEEERGSLMGRRERAKEERLCQGTLLFSLWLEGTAFPLSVMLFIAHTCTHTHAHTHTHTHTQALSGGSLKATVTWVVDCKLWRKIRWIRVSVP